MSFPWSGSVHVLEFKVCSRWQGGGETQFLCRSYTSKNYDWRKSLLPDHCILRLRVVFSPGARRWPSLCLKACGHGLGSFPGVLMVGFRAGLCAMFSFRKTELGALEQKVLLTGCGTVCLMGGLCCILVSMYYKALRKTVSLGLDEETEVQRCCSILRVSSSTSQRKSQVWAAGGLGGVVEVLFALINMNKKFVSKTLDSFFFPRVSWVSSWHLIMYGLRVLLGLFCVLSFS